MEGAVFFESRPSCLLDDLRALDDAHQIPAVVALTDAPRHVAVLRKCVAKGIAHHGIVGALCGLHREVVAHSLEALRPVEIIRIDHCEGLVNERLGHQHGMGRTPRFGPFSRDGVPGGNLVQFLEGVMYVRARLVFSADAFPKILLDVSADDENDLSETRAERVVNRVVENDFTAGSDLVELFQPAVATADPGGKYEKCGFWHNLFFTSLLHGLFRSTSSIRALRLGVSTTLSFFFSAVFAGLPKFEQ